MMKERYEIQDHKLFLIDPDLDLCIEEDFSLPSLSYPIKNPPEGFSLKKMVWENRGLEIFLEKEGKRIGETLYLYPDGSLKASLFYDENQNLHGPSCFFSPDTQILSQGWFYRGKKQGKFFYYYHPSNNLSACQSYRRGLLEGEQLFYYDNKKLKTSLLYKNGRLEGKVSLFWPDGTIKREAFFMEGKKYGEDAIYNERGEKISPIKK